MYRRILAAIDGSHASDRALEEAIRISREAGASLLVVHALEDPPAVLEDNPYAEDALRTLKASRKEAGANLLKRAKADAAAAGVNAEATLLDEDAMPTPARILRAAQAFNADLIVLGTHGHHGLRRAMLGSSAEGVVRMAPVPVLLVPTP
jgi:nucleotide-binding universal stress UspA family protein